MAVVNRSSDTITNATATPATFNNAGNVGGTVRHAGGFVTVAADDSTTSVQRGARVPSNAYIQQVLVSAADFTTGGAIDVGVYQIAANGGAVVDADLFASAFVMTNGPTSNVDVTHESGQYTVAERSQPLWQALGLSSDPNREYDIAATITTDFNGGQNYRIDVLYTL
jgi:hypothetical protein